MILLKRRLMKCPILLALLLAQLLLLCKKWNLLMATSAMLRKMLVGTMALKPVSAAFLLLQVTRNDGTACEKLCRRVCIPLLTFRPLLLPPVALILCIMALLVCRMSLLWELLSPRVSARNVLVPRLLRCPPILVCLALSAVVPSLLPCDRLTWCVRTRQLLIRWPSRTLVLVRIPCLTRRRRCGPSLSLQSLPVVRIRGVAMSRPKVLPRPLSTI